MTERVVEFTEEEKALLIKHLNGMSELYFRVNSSGDGPLSSLITKIESEQLVIKFESFESDRLLRHLKGASGYNKVVYGSDSLDPLIKKIDSALHPKRTYTRPPSLIKRRTEP